MNRRTLLAGGSTLTLAACSGMTGTQLAADAEAMANAVAEIAVSLEAVLPANDAALLNQVEQAAVTAGQDASAFGGLIPLSGATIAQDATGIANAITTLDPIVLQFFPQSAPVIIVLNAALALVPTFLAEAGAPPAASAKVRALSIAMSPDVARLTLSHVSKRAAKYR